MPKPTQYKTKTTVPTPLVGATSAEIRSKLVEALKLDLVGPDNTHPFAHEILPQSPRRWYLAGFLVPKAAPKEAKHSKDDEDEGEQGFEKDGDDQGDAQDKVNEVSLLPASIGLSVMVPAGVTEVRAVVRWGDYDWENRNVDFKLAELDEEVVDKAFDQEWSKDEAEAAAALDAKEEPKTAFRGYQREPREEAVEITLNGESGRTEIGIPNSRGLQVVASWKALHGLADKGIAEGTRTLSVFLVNDRQCSGRVTFRDIIYQAELELGLESGFFGRPDLRGAVFTIDADADDRIADLHYRDELEFAVGHGVASVAEADSAGICRKARTTCLPMEEVPRMDHAGAESIGGTELRMEELATLDSAESASRKLMPLVESYRAWIAVQQAKVDGSSLSGVQRETANDLLALASNAADRIEAGIHALETPICLEAFRIANRAMARAARQRFAVQQGKKPEEVQAPGWRAFQLAFLLMNLRGMHDPSHYDRQVVDLLFFPTGGGKTEAYLGLAAFTLVLRRLANPGISSAGVSIIMRYTLRLLTLDQLGRAAALMCALEKERESNKTLGDWPFEIGLWVGSAATPNRMGKAGDTSPGKDNTAYSKLTKYLRNPEKHPAPIPLEECPWCGNRFEPDSFQFDPPGNNPKNLHVACMNMECDFSSASGNRLPILGVDEPIYRRLPCFLIATVDKFAALPWTGRTGALFGRVERWNAEGFFGPCDTGAGSSLPTKGLPPPDLIIQDELHLISGPLGTVAGIYETVIEQLCQKALPNGKTQVPKIVASTATVRQAQRQIRALFGRANTAIFPPQGPDRHDSFFAKTIPVSSENPGRLYLGVAGQGRSMKVAFLRASLALLSGCEVLHRAAGGSVAGNPADPYMTLLAYFNSLRELGGSRRIVEDEITARLLVYWRRKRRMPEEGLFDSRLIKRTPLELTSRVETDQIAQARRQLALGFELENHTDVALATNMISVGLDIVRLGLMVVFGQPKTTSEYIQATSRVGRSKDKPGLVVTLLNPHKPRDRSHYERFSQYHRTFYRSVESTSVTPFSPRALERALAGAMVGLCRHMLGEMEPYLAAGLVQAHHAKLQDVVRIFSERARSHDLELTSEESDELARVVDDRAQALLGDWCKIAREQSNQGVGLNYQKYEDRPSSGVLLRDFLDPDLKSLPPTNHRFRANRSMREVETPVDIIVQESAGGTN